MSRDEAYKEIARLAAEHALIAKAGGGLITIAHPDSQKRLGLEAQCLYMAGQGPHPSEVKQK